MAVIDPDGLFEGERICACSDEAQNWFARLFCAANNYGRMPLDVPALIQRCFASYRVKPTHDQVMDVIHEYVENCLILPYRADGHVWVQFAAKEKWLRGYKTTADERSPAPSAEDWNGFEKRYAAWKERRKNIVVEDYPELFPKDFEKTLEKVERVSENLSENPPENSQNISGKFSHGIGRGIGRGRGRGSGRGAGGTNSAGADAPSAADAAALSSRTPPNKPNEPGPMASASAQAFEEIQQQRANGKARAAPDSAPADEDFPNAYQQNRGKLVACDGLNAALRKKLQACRASRTFTLPRFIEAVRASAEAPNTAWYANKDFEWFIRDGGNNVDKVLQDRKKQPHKITYAGSYKDLAHEGGKHAQR